MSNNLDEAFDNYVPEVSDKEVENALKRSKPAAGIYLARSLGNSKAISKVEKGGKGRIMCVENFALVRPTDGVVSATEVTKYHILPIIPRAWMLAAAGYDGWTQTGVDPNTNEPVGDIAEGSKIHTVLSNYDPDGPKKMFLNKWRGRLRAGFGKEAYSDYPAPVEGSNYKQWTLADGSTVTEETAAQAKGALIKAVKLAAWASLRDKTFFKGQDVYLDLSYQKDKDTGKESDMPNIEFFSHISNPPKDKDGQPKIVLDPFVSVK